MYDGDGKIEWDRISRPKRGGELELDRVYVNWMLEMMRLSCSQLDVDLRSCRPYPPWLRQSDHRQLPRECRYRQEAMVTSCQAHYLVCEGCEKRKRKHLNTGSEVNSLPRTNNSPWFYKTQLLCSTLYSILVNNRVLVDSLLTSFDHVYSERHPFHPVLKVFIHRANFKDFSASQDTPA